MPQDRLLTLTDLLLLRAQVQRDEVAYQFWTSEDKPLASITYEQLLCTAIDHAGYIKPLISYRDRILLLLPPSLEYIVNFFACIYAGGIPVPAFPPRVNKSDLRIAAIISDAKPSLYLADSSFVAKIQQSNHELNKRLPSLSFDNTSMSNRETLAVEDIAPHITQDDIAFLQYTSGSTANPKGVMVTHGNLLHNLSHTQTTYRAEPSSSSVIWLPPYHDMGLIGGIMQPLFVGYPTVLLDPTAFIQSPIRWLTLMSQFKATITGAPNFAYDLCVRQTTEEQRQGLDLSHWNVALNGAEPVSVNVMQRFAEIYQPFGFNPAAFYPSYGLAEATLLVSAEKRTPVYRSIEVDRKSLQKGIVVEVPHQQTDDKSRRQILASCGTPLSDQVVVIVDPYTLNQAQSDTIGEIWISGPSVALGYWNRPDATQETFLAELKEHPGRRFLRTGDLGFFRDSELYIVGRLKDLIIIRGANFYPEDIEDTVSRCHESLLPTGAAFTIDFEEEARLVIVHEIKRGVKLPNVNEIARRIVSAVAETHGIQVETIVLVRCYTIPKTSSGKIQRKECMKRFLNDELNIIDRWSRNMSDNQDFSFTRPTVSTATGSNKLDIEMWIMHWIAHHSGIPKERVSSQLAFFDYGLDSIAITQMMYQLSEYLGAVVEVILAWNYPSPEQLANYLSERDKERHLDHTPKRALDQQEISTAILADLTTREIAELLVQEIRELHALNKGVNS